MCVHMCRGLFCDFFALHTFRGDHFALHICFEILSILFDFAVFNANDHDIVLPKKCLVWYMYPTMRVIEIVPSLERLFIEIQSCHSRD